MTECHLATDAAEVNCRITCGVTGTNNHHSLVSVAVFVSDRHKLLNATISQKTTATIFSVMCIHAIERAKFSGDFIIH